MLNNQLAQLAQVLGPAANAATIPVQQGALASMAGQPGIPPTHTAHAAPPPDTMQIANDQEEWEDQSNDNTPQWTDLFKSSRVDATSPQGQQLWHMHQAPPPLMELKQAQSEIVLYSGVPETPPPTKSPIDKRLLDAQAKFEAIMHLSVRALEDDDKKHIMQLSAWARSGWEDIHQLRRKNFAGRQSWKLDGRVDDNRCRLVTSEEEKKLRAGKGKGKGSGKGKGKGKGSQPTWQPSQSSPAPWRSNFRRSRSASSSRKPEQK